MIIGVAPEGSRQKGHEMENRFSKNSWIDPSSKILFFAIDAPSKCILIGDIFIPTGKVEEDLEFVKELFHRTFKGINPEQF